MPITPYHLGLGALAKSITPKKISFQVFFLSQVLMDIQPGVNLMLGWRPVHGWTHTYWGAFFISILTASIWKTWEKIRPKIFMTPPVNSFVLIISCLFGTLSHVWLDSQYHQDMGHLTPEVLKFLAPSQVEPFCLVAMGTASIIFVIRATLSHYRHK